MQFSFGTRSVRKVLASPDIALDLGTANTRLYAQGRGLLADEPSVVQVRPETGLVEAVGFTAAQKPLLERGARPAYISVANQYKPYYRLAP